LIKNGDWDKKARKGFLASGIDPGDRRGHKNVYIDILQKMALDEVLALKGDETVLDFGCGSGRLAYWIAPRVKKVFGLEVTQEMVDMAEKNRSAWNVEFFLYDGVQFPALTYSLNIILSVGVLCIMKGKLLKSILSNLTQYLNRDGMFYLVEQVSDNPKIGRPSLNEYLQAFKESKLVCLQYYPIRNGRWWMLYLIRYGVIPKGWFRKIAFYELEKRKREKGIIHFYKDFIFLLRKE
jgi:SAM-dependent methyltransferase